MKTVSLSVIVPVFNEEKTILKVLQALNKLQLEDTALEVIVVNDGSNDRTNEILAEHKNLYNLYLKNEKNQGKGAAIIKGIEASNSDYIIFQDSDLEYDPNNFDNFVKIIKKFNPDYVSGSRFHYRNYTRSHYFFNNLGNKILTFLFNMLYNTTFRDIYTCYICFKKKLLDTSKINAKGFESHVQIQSQVIKKSSLIYEISIDYNGRTTSEGKKIKFYHFFSVVFYMFIERFKN